MHTLLDLRGNIPSFIHVSDGKLHDVNVLDLLIPEPAAIYVMDRAYLDFERLCALHQAGAFFVTRAKSNADLRRVYSAPERSGARHHMRSDGGAVRLLQSQTLPAPFAPHSFQRSRVGEDAHLFDQPVRSSATTVCELYKARWQVELFFDCVT